MAKKQDVEKVMCTACGNLYVKTEFSPSSSFKNKKSGRLEICKNCCGDLYDRLMLKYNDEIKAIYRMCMIEDLYFSKDLINTIIGNSKNSDKNYGFIYVNKMGLVQYKNKTFEDSKDIMNVFDISESDFQDMLFLNAEKSKENAMKESMKIITPEVIARWGKDYEVSEYAFLEERYQIMLNSYDVTMRPM